MCIDGKAGYKDHSVKILIDRSTMLVSEVTHISVAVSTSRIQNENHAWLYYDLEVGREV